MMFTWEWNPSFGAETKPQQFNREGIDWTYARGEGFNLAAIIPIISSGWAAILWIAKAPLSDKVPATIFSIVVTVGWALSRRFHERGWRVDRQGHLTILTHSGAIQNLGKIRNSRLVTEDDFSSFDSKSFNSLRWPMLRFSSNGKKVGVIGSIHALYSQGFSIPFSLGFFYSSITWGSFRQTKGAESTAWVETEANGDWLLIAYTPSALANGLSSSLPLDTNRPS